MKMKLGELIKKYRKENHMTMQDFADKSGLSKGYVSMIEKGKHPNSGKPIIPKFDTYAKAARAMGLSLEELIRMLDDNQLIDISPSKVIAQRKAVKVPILGKVVAGLPISAYEDILGFEEITPEMAAQGEHYALRVTGDSMYPQICDGDIVLVRVQSDVESEDVAVVFVNGDEATLKKVKKEDKGITIYGYNSAVYEPHFFTNEEIKKLPITISGKVVELRRSF